ncbi:GAF and ANTAR domain-containing protein [Kocuria flava]|uniref:GAF and ANTAR domain-containing protein n=1 Tax=Kocuria flava TaxID=446860 RepID=UPI002F93233C
MTEHAAGPAPAERLQDLLLESEDIAGFLEEFTRTMAAAFSGGGQSHCAVTLIRHRRGTTVASSSPEAALLDEVQYGFEEGPCLTAVRERRTVHVPDLRTDGRWPAYAEAAGKVGVRAVLGVPFELEDEAQAGFNVYAERPGAFDDDTVRTVQREVLLASKGLRLAVRLARHREEREDLRAAMRSRTPIDLAVGIVMGQNRCSQERAVEILKAASSHRNVKLSDLAADLVATVGRGPAATHFEA